MTTDSANKTDGPGDETQLPPETHDSLNRGQSWLSRFFDKEKWEFAKTVVGTIQPVLTFLAIMVGVVWFFARGEIKTRLSVDHDTTFVKLNEHGWLATLNVRIENQGNLEVAINRVEIRAQQVLPVSPIIKERLEAGYHIVVQDEDEVDWPLLEAATILPEMRIRPGEVDVVSFDLMLPRDVELVKLSSFVLGPAEGVGWTKRSLGQS